MRSHFTICTGKPLNQWKNQYQIPPNMKKSPKCIGVEKDRSFFYLPILVHGFIKPWITNLLNLLNHAMSLVSPLNREASGEARKSVADRLPIGIRMQFTAVMGTNVLPYPRQLHLNTCSHAVVQSLGRYFHTVQSHVWQHKTYCMGLLTRTLPHA